MRRCLYAYGLLVAVLELCFVCKHYRAADLRSGGDTFAVTGFQPGDRPSLSRWKRYRREQSSVFARASDELQRSLCATSLSCVCEYVCTAHGCVSVLEKFGPIPSAVPGFCVRPLQFFSFITRTDIVFCRSSLTLHNYHGGAIHCQRLQRAVRPLQHAVRWTSVRT